jgi:hypothetical protein
MAADRHSRSGLTSTARAATSLGARSGDARSRSRRAARNARVAASREELGECVGQVRQVLAVAAHRGAAGSSSPFRAARRCRTA